jgi:hypothetical protein
MLFAETGFRPLWPVIFFLPWLLVGIAYLFAARAAVVAPQNGHCSARAP